MHYYIEKYTTDNRAHGAKAKKMVPYSRSLAKFGNELVKVE